MYLKHTQTRDMVEVLDLDALFDPCKAQVTGRYHAGEEMQDAQKFDKVNLVFPSNEALPQCWVNKEYRKSH